jgi:hypothetical protein
MDDHDSLIVAYWHDYVTRCVNGEMADQKRWFWAWEDVQERVERTPDDSLPLLVDLAEFCASAQALAYLGAGPVEDLVKRADDALFARMLTAAQKSARFRRALATIWIDDERRIGELDEFFGRFPPDLPNGVLDDTEGP